MATRPTGPRYRRISVQMWGDDKFRALSKPQPNGQSLWQFLLTGPHTLNVPGLFVAGEAMLAESLNWPLTKFHCAWSELELADLVQCDWAARVVWIPKAVNHNLPESPNVVRSWWETIPLIPVSPIRDIAVAQLREACERKGEAYLKAFDEGFLKAFPKAFRLLSGKPSGEPLGKGEAKPKVNQEQEQEQEQEVKNPPTPLAGGLFPKATRAERQHAERVRASWFGCQHDPRCDNHEVCVEVIIATIREKRSMSA